MQRIDSNKLKQGSVSPASTLSGCLSGKLTALAVMVILASIAVVASMASFRSSIAPVAADGIEWSEKTKISDSSSTMSRPAGQIKDGSLDTSFRPVFDDGTGDVLTSAQQPDGKILVALDAGAGVRTRLVRLDVNGTVDPTFSPGPGVNEELFISTILVRPNGKIIITGIAFRPTATFYYASQLNSDGSLDPDFEIIGDPNQQSTVSALAPAALQADGKLLIGGSFNVIRNVSRAGFARLNADGTLDTAFNPGTNGSLEEIAVQNDGKIIIASSQNVIRRNADGTLDSTFSAGNLRQVNQIKVLSDGKLFVVGDFSQIGAVTRLGVVRLNENGSIDTTFNPSPGALFVECAEIQSDGKMIIGGGFSTVNNVSRRGIARLNTNGTLDNTFNPGEGIGNGIRVETLLLQPAGTLFVGGDFTTFNGLSRVGIAQVTASGSPTAAFNLNFFGGLAVVRAIAEQPDGKIIAGGTYDSVNGVLRPSLVRLDQNGSTDQTFDPSIASPGDIFSLAVQPDGKILVAGDFDFLANGDGRNIVRLNPNGSLDPTFNVDGTDTGSVQALRLQPDGKIIIAGSFGGVSGQTRSRIARLNSDGSVDTGFFAYTSSNGPNAIVYGLALQQDGKIIVAGDFTSFGGTARNRVARLNQNGSLDTTFNIGTGANASVLKPEIQSDGKVLVAGHFTSFGGQSRSYVARLNSDGSVDTGFTPFMAFSNPVSSMTIQSDGKVLVGGLRETAGLIGIDRLNADGSLDTGFTVTFNSAASSVRSIFVQNNGRILTGGRFDLVNEYGQAAMARLLGGGPTPTPTPTPASTPTPTPVTTPTPMATPTVTPSPNPSTTPTPVPSLTPLITPTPTPSPIPTTTPSPSPTPTPIVGCQTPQFGLPVSVAVNGPVAAAPGDFNLDGNVDLAVLRNTFAGPFPGVVELLLGNGAGTFTSTGIPYNALPVGGQILINDLAAADFNNDGKLDLVAVGTGQGIAAILLGNGNGTFGQPTNFPVPNNASRVIVADFNADGHADVLTRGFSSASVLPGFGNGTLAAAVNVTVGDGSGTLVARDFNRDGFLDFATANNSSISQSISIRLGNGSIIFTPAPDIPVARLQSLVANDFNRDGHPDLATVNRSNENISMFLNTGSGMFSSPSGSPFPTGDFPENITSADFNGDLFPDIANTNSTTNNSLSILLNNRSGGLGSAFFLSPDQGSSARLYPLDLDNNRVSDLVILKDILLNKVVFLRNFCPPPVASMSGRVTTPSGQGLRNAVVNLTDGQGARRTSTTSSFGIYTFTNVLAGETYTISVASKRYRFAPRTLAVSGDLSNIDFVGLE